MCQQFAEERKPVALGNMDVASTSNVVLGMDVVGPLPTIAAGYRYMITLICYTSGFAIVVPCCQADNVAVRAGL